MLNEDSDYSRVFSVHATSISVGWLILRHLNCNLRSLIEILFWESEYLVVQLRCVVAFFRWSEHTSVQYDAEACHVAFLHHLHAALVSIFRILTRDLPIALLLAKNS